MRKRQIDTRSFYFPPKKRIRQSGGWSTPDIASTKSEYSETAEEHAGPLNYFYIFRWLLRELQLQIWETAAMDIDSQIITITREVHRHIPPPRINPYHKGRAYIHNQFVFLKAHYTVPNLLHACGVARDVALKYYRPAFSRELGGSCLYIAIDDRRAPDTFYFTDLYVLQMLRSRTRFFGLVKSDIDSIKFAVVATDVEQRPRKNSASLRWISSSLRGLEILWVAEEFPYKAHAPNRYKTMFLRHMLAAVMIRERATPQQQHSIAGHRIHDESVKCVMDPAYCFAKWGFRRVPQAKAITIHQLKEVAGQAVGTMEQSRFTIEFLNNNLKENFLV